jgi:hypothetical protein
MTPRLTVTLWRGGSIGFWTTAWPLLFGRLFTSEEINHLLFLGPAIDAVFGQVVVRAHLPNAEMLSKKDGRGALTQRHFAPSSDPPTHDIFLLFSNIFRHLAYFLARLLLHIFLHLFHIMQPNGLTALFVQYKKSKGSSVRVQGSSEGAV